ncbi:MAG: hypothetical protein EBU46_20880 [Nitrosomonadaceae bacterium]|nr:hypothetical protein [Nitrosomonadaceae bacterium]
MSFFVTGQSRARPARPARLAPRPAPRLAPRPARLAPRPAPRLAPRAAQLAPRPARLRGLSCALLSAMQGPPGGLRVASAGATALARATALVRAMASARVGA